MAEKSVVSQRLNPILNERGEQVEVNLLSLDGGRPYILKRLSRFPGESDVNWRGHEALTGVSKLLTAGDTTSIHGRRDRTEDPNLPGRIVQKLCQYVFAKTPEREGIDEAFALDVTLGRLGIDQFWKRVLSVQTAAKWCWVRVDGPAPPMDPKGNLITMSVADRRRDGIRPFWSIHNPLQVVDWRFNERGELDYLIQEDNQVSDEDPRAPRTSRKVRVVWEPGSVEYHWFKDDDGDTVESVTEAANPPDFVPWVPHGPIDDAAHWFDGVEARNRTIMNLTSVGDDTALDQCYGLLVLAEGMIERTKSSHKALTYDQTVALILGKSHPATEDENSKGVTRYVTPSAADLGLIDSKVANKKRDLFEFVGFALKPESAQVESAEAKAWDHLDVEMVLRDNAGALQETEAKVVEMTKRLDPNWQAYSPEYADTFDVGDIAAEMAAIIGVNQLSLPFEAKKALAKGAFVHLRNRGALKIPAEDYEAAVEAIDKMEESDFSPVDPAFLDETGTDDGDEGDED